MLHVYQVIISSENKFVQIKQKNYGEKKELSKTRLQNKICVKSAFLKINNNLTYQS